MKTKHHDGMAATRFLNYSEIIYFDVAMYTLQEVLNALLLITHILPFFSQRVSTVELTKTLVCTLDT